MDKHSIETSPPKNFLSIGIFFILVDGSFSHVLHNTHRYLIIGLIICYILTTISFKKFDYIKYFFIGFVYTFSSLSIVVTGLITGLTGIFFFTIFILQENNYVQENHLY